MRRIPAPFPPEPELDAQQYEAAKQRVRSLIEEGLASGPATAWSEEDERELMAIARGEIE